MILQKLLKNQVTIIEKKILKASLTMTLTGSLAKIHAYLIGKLEMFQLYSVQNLSHHVKSKMYTLLKNDEESSAHMLLLEFVIY